jgi:hypothetical protein
MKKEIEEKIKNEASKILTDAKRTDTTSKIVESVTSVIDEAIDKKLVLDDKKVKESSTTALTKLVGKAVNKCFQDEIKKQIKDVLDSKIEKAIKAGLEEKFDEIWSQFYVEVRKIVKQEIGEDVKRMVRYLLDETDLSSIIEADILDKINSKVHILLFPPSDL